MQNQIILKCNNYKLHQKFSYFNFHIYFPKTQYQGFYNWQIDSQHQQIQLLTISQPKLINYTFQKDTRYQKDINNLNRQNVYQSNFKAIQMHLQEDNLQSYQEHQFPAFPVVFQQQVQQSSASRSRNPGKQSSNGIFGKFPQKQLNQLKQIMSEPKYNIKYHFLWTQQLSKIKVDQFLNHTYKPFDAKFLDQFKKQLPNIQMYRLGQYKVYIGSIEEQKCGGKCVLMFKNGVIYEGQMLQNKRNGKGIYFDPNLGYYNGYFKNDSKQGEAIQVLQNKTIYKGNYVNGVRQGNNGFYVDSNQNQYFGQWKLGIMHGKGFLKSKNSIYYGNFVNWLKHGQGQQIFIEGDIFKGQYQNGRFDGFGVYKWSNSNAVYQGTFKNGFRHGKGKWTQNQTKYLGNFVENVKQGYGELYFPSGNFYKGNFVNDKRQGYGQMFWNDGSFFKGQWKNGVQNGKGQIYLAGGQIMSGIFQNSILVQVTPSTYQKQLNNQYQAQNSHDLISSQPRGILGVKNRTYSQSKGFNNRKKLARIDETVRKPQYSINKTKMYFKSPQKSDHSLSKGKDHYQSHRHGHDHGHGHGHGKQCKCVKRLENFRLKQQKGSKVMDSRFNNINI